MYPKCNPGRCAARTQQDGTCPSARSSSEVDDIVKLVVSGVSLGLAPINRGHRLPGISYRGVTSLGLVWLRARYVVTYSSSMLLHLIELFRAAGMRYESR